MVAKNNTHTVANSNKKDKSNEPSFSDQLKSYFKGVKSEWKKITWPDRQQITSETLVVIVFTIFVTLLIFLIDMFWKFLFGLVSHLN